MSSEAGDFRVEVIQAPPRTFAVSGGTAPIDLMSPLPGRVSLSGLGQINRAIDRNLLTFKTGDMTLELINRDGYFDDLFAFLGPTDRWTLRIFRRDALQFTGTIMGLGSIRYDRLAKTIELTAYGASRALADASAATVMRNFITTGPPSTDWFTVASATGGSSTLTLNSYVYLQAPLTTGDILHITDHINSEDVTVRFETGNTVLTLEAPLVHSYAAGSQVTLTTPFYRYKSIATLVQLLFTEAGIALADLRISNSQFNTLGPTPQNLSGLPLLTTSNPAYTCPAQKNGSEYLTLLVNGTYFQTTPDVDWAVGDATIRAWVDWSKYFVQASTGPAIVPRTPFVAENNGSTTDSDPHICGWDLRGSTMAYYRIRRVLGQLHTATSTDGTTWGASTAVAINPTIPTFNNPDAGQNFGCEFDPVRNQVLVWCTEGPTATLQLYDVGTGAWTDCRTGADAGYCHGGFSYCADLDCFIGLRTAQVYPSPPIGPTFQIVAYRGATLFWTRTFPNCLVATYASGVLNYPTHSIRYINGKLYVPVLSDGKAQLVVSGDQFASYAMRAIEDPSTGARIFGARVNGAYLIACYQSTLQRGLLYAAPFYAGVVDYADHTGLSVSQALQNLAVLANAVAWVDDDLQGHFVSRDLLPIGPPLAIDDRMMQRIDIHLWDQSNQYVTVSGGQAQASAGIADFSRNGLTVNSPLIPNEAFAQALADSYFAFYSKQRRFIESVLTDRDGTIYKPLDRITMDGIRYMVYESNHDLTGDQVSVQLLEDV